MQLNWGLVSIPPDQARAVRRSARARWKAWLGSQRGDHRRRPRERPTQGETTFVCALLRAPCRPCRQAHGVHGLRSWRSFISEPCGHDAPKPTQGRRPLQLGGFGYHSGGRHSRSPCACPPWCPGLGHCEVALHSSLPHSRGNFHFSVARKSSMESRYAGHATARSCAAGGRGNGSSC